jgi:trimethylamine--corrinoid protein Co-methyltransferase
MAGALAQQHAEVLASIVLAAAACPGAPVAYCSRLSPIDLRRAVSSWGGPEVGLAGAAATQLAHRHGLKCDTYGFSTDANRFDPQFAYEKFANALLPALAGADMLSGVGTMGNGLAATAEGAVIDDEMIGLIRHILRGYEVTDETLAFDVMAEVIRRDGNFLGESHTVEQMRKGALWTTPIHFYQGLWMPGISERAAGTDEEPDLGVVARAHARVLEILDTPVTETLPDAVNQHLAEILEKAKKAKKA